MPASARLAPTVPEAGRSLMNSYQLNCPPCTITIKGFDPSGAIIRHRRRLQPHNGPTVALTVAYPLDDPKTFNIPVGLQGLALRKKVASYGALLTHAQGRELTDLIYQFAEYVVNNHGFSKPYRVSADLVDQLDSWD